jgi:hypothetical protein
MSVRSDIRQMAERLLPANGKCPGDPSVKFAGFLAEGEPEPQPPLCGLCKTRHWPPRPPIWFVVVGHSSPREDGTIPEVNPR